MKNILLLSLFFCITSAIKAEFSQDEMRKILSDPEMQTKFISQLEKSDKIEPKLLNSIKKGLFTRSNIFLSFKNGNISPILSKIEQSFTPQTSKSERANLVHKSLKEHSQLHQAGILNYLQNFRPFITGFDYKGFWITNQVFIKGAPTGLISMLADLPQIAKISQERTYRLIESRSNGQVAEEFSSKQTGNTTKTIEWGVSKIQADKVWSTSNGSGVVVGIIDTGVRITHESLKNKWVGGDKGWLDGTYWPAWSWSNKPYDDQGHGTHCMGSILGGTSTRGIGVAPGAKYIACKALNAIGMGMAHQILICMEFMGCPFKRSRFPPYGIEEDCSLAPDIVSNSWGADQREADAQQEDAIEVWRKSGIIPVFAAGNSGPNCSTVGSPGGSPNVITVGATDEMDIVAYFSSVGPGYDPLATLKPDVNITSASIKSDTAYEKMSGTSMATPHVSGVVALILSGNPKLQGNYDEVYRILTTSVYKNDNQNRPVQCTNSTNDPQVDYHYHYGFGRVDCVKTMDAVLKP